QPTTKATEPEKSQATPQAQSDSSYSDAFLQDALASFDFMADIGNEPEPPAQATSPTAQPSPAAPPAGAPAKKGDSFFSLDDIAAGFDDILNEPSPAEPTPATNQAAPPTDTTTPSQAPKQAPKATPKAANPRLTVRKPCFTIFIPRTGGRFWRFAGWF
ncbi:MAG TPA: hypothetical protein V6D20_04800, partial [Candidatus Obscuribacterales bacterium]